MTEELVFSSPMDPDELQKIEVYWRAANYLSIGQTCLMRIRSCASPCAKSPSNRACWPLGTTPGLNFIYAHVNRVIKAHHLNAIYICGPGHGGPGMVG